MTAPVQPALEPTIALIRAIRPDWSPQAVHSALERCEGRTWQSKLVAIVRVAVDAKSDSPARVVQDGPWWQVSGTGPAPWRPPVTVRGDYVARAAEARALLAARRARGGNNDEERR